MNKISQWSVVRSGASLTVTGKNADGSPAKLTRIERIDGDRVDGPVAIRGGDRFLLA
jgi:hypothetical protein